ncbi:MAG: YtxH domain-containing protein [Rhodothermales bacterium]
MNTRQTILLTAISAFAGGFFAGLIFAPQTGRETRQRLVRTAQGSTRWLGEQLDAVEAKIGVLEQQIHKTTSQFTEKVRETAHHTVDQYVPSMPDDTKAWTVEREDLAHDLRRMPRK